MEGAFADEQRRHADTQKNIRKQDKRIKDLIMQVSLTLSLTPVERAFSVPTRWRVCVHDSAESFKPQELLQNCATVLVEQSLRTAVVKAKSNATVILVSGGG